MDEKTRPGWWQSNYSWQPAWRKKWKPLDERTFMRFLAFLMVLSLHKTGGEEEVSSRHWLYYRPCIERFFSSKEFSRIKAALHCQKVGEEEGQTALDGKQQLRKI
eukprot:412908-Rhodomonas_salina.1